jgi:molybdopterin-guanine dinucleotide biosynthesis protein A
MTKAEGAAAPGDPRDRIVGVLLAGGLSRRMGGGDKALRPLAGRPIVAHVIDRARGQTAALVLNSNGDPARFSDFGLPVVADCIEGHAGPLAGVLTGLEWAARERPDCPWIATFACDAPFLPHNLAVRLLAETEEAGADMACATSRGRDHPVFGLWPVRLREELRRAMVEEEIRKVDVWTARYRLARADFPDVVTPWGPFDPFFNANRPEDLAEAEQAFVP